MLDQNQQEVKAKKVIVMDSVFYACPICLGFCSEETNYEKLKPSCEKCKVALTK